MTTPKDLLDGLDRLMADVASYRSGRFEKGGESADIVFAGLEALHGLADTHAALQKLAHAVDTERKIPVKICRCEEKDGTYDIRRCPVHTVDHPAENGCCKKPREAHRHLTQAEYAARYPVVFDETVRCRSLKRYRIDARRYDDRIGVTVTDLFKDDDDAGLAFDIPQNDLADIMDALQAALAAG